MNTVPLGHMHEIIREGGRGRIVPVPPLLDATSMRTVRVPHNRRWPMIEIIAKRTSLFQSVVFAAPNIWQLEPMVFNACRALRIPLAVGVAYNPLVTLEVARQLSRALVILDVAHANQYANALMQAPAPGHILWVGHASDGVVYSPRNILSSSSGVTELIPGFPLMYECPHAKHGHVHLSDEYIWNETHGRAVIEPVTDSFLCGHVELPFSVQKTAPCSCGLQAYEVITK